MLSFTIYIHFYKTSHRMKVLLLVGGVQRKKDKQPRHFHLNVIVVYILLVRRYTDAMKLTTAYCLLLYMYFFLKDTILQIIKLVFN